MPSYEMPILLRTMSKPDTVATLRRVADSIFKAGGFIRKIDNLGRKPTPFKISSHGKVHKEAQYFMYYFDVPPSTLITIQDEYKRDIDIIKRKIYQIQTSPEYECQLEEETLPAPYRKDVQKMLEIAKRKALKDSFKEKYYSNLKDFPFQT